MRSKFSTIMNKITMSIFLIPSSNGDETLTFQFRNVMIFRIRMQSRIRGGYIQLKILGYINMSDRSPAICVRPC